MPVTQDDVAACVKLALREMEGRRWPAGPVVDAKMWATPQNDRVGPEAKSFTVDLDTACTWIDAVERTAGGTEAAVQLLRRLWYSSRFPGGAKFDGAIKTDESRLPRTPTVRQAVLDGLARSGLLKIDPASSDRDVDLSHIFVTLDYALNGDGRDASRLKLIVSSDSSVQGMLSWLGDLASVWTGFQSLRQRWMLAHPGQTPARGAPDQPDTEAWWLEKAFADRSPTSDLLGDMDGVILAAELVKNPSQSVAVLLRSYYTTLAAPAPGDVNVANRLSLFLQRSDPVVPASTAGGQVSITADANAALRRMVDVSSRLLLGAARVANRDWWGALKASGEVGSDWGQWAVGEIGDRFARFLEAMAANSSTLAVWPVSQPAPVNLGYAAAVRGRVASVLMSGDPTGTPVDALETFVQYYITSNDPWGLPPTPGSALSPVWLGDFTGKAARSAPPGSPADIIIDDVFPWSEIWPGGGTGIGEPHRDLIKLDGATTGSGVFRIVAVNLGSHTLTLDSDPGLGGGASAWTIKRRPRLVVVDAFGYRPHLTGVAASMQTGSVTVTAVRIDVDTGTVAALQSVNMGIDTIMLDDDEGVPRLPFRVLSIDTTDPSHPLIGLDRPPALSQPSRWQIPAGIGGGAADIATSSPPSAGAGCDHYDGLMFLVYGDQVQQVFPWTSYTSFRHGVTSLRGNRKYDAHAFRSVQGDGAQFRNHCFMVHEVSQRPTPLPQQDDNVPGRDYYAGVVTMPKTADTTVPPADHPESLIRLHYGNKVPAGGNLITTGSAGCLVSPNYYDMRARLIEIYQGERGDLGLQADPNLQKVHDALTDPAAEATWNTVPSAQWDGIVVAELFVVHPDERSSQPVAPLSPWRDT